MNQKMSRMLRKLNPKVTNKTKRDFLALNTHERAKVRAAYKASLKRASN